MIINSDDKGKKVIFNIHVKLSLPWKKKELKIL